jgi:uncharacterized protein (DUF2267 family)
MTVPFQYAHASEEFDRFLQEAKVALDHVTTHQTYQTIESLLRVFRRRLAVEDALAFADALPAVLRAIFVADWHLDEPQRPFASLSELNRELQQIRRNHDFSPDNAIEIVAPIVTKYTDRVQFDRVLATLPPEAKAFWS